MNEHEIATFRQKLEARRAELIAEGDIEIEPVRTDPSENADEDAAPLTEMNQVIASRRNKTRALELERINGALARLATTPEDFGDCADCGEPIGPKRLELMPWALYCVSCQEARSPSRGKRRRHIADYLD